MRGCGDGNGVSQFTADIFLSHSTELFRRGTLQGVTDFGYRKLFRLRELCLDDFFVETFCLAVPKNFAGAPIRALFRKVSCSEKVCRYGREGEVSRSSFKHFGSHSAEIFVREIFGVSLIWCIEKFYA